MVAKGYSTNQHVYVVAELIQSLLGPPTIGTIGLAHRVDYVTVAQTEADFKLAYPAVFQGLGKLKEPYHTKLEKGSNKATHCCLSKPRHVSLPL